MTAFERGLYFGFGLIMLVAGVGMRLTHYTEPLAASTAFLMAAPLYMVVGRRQR